MEITGTQRIGASRETVWEALNDPGVLRRSIPGCESLEEREDGYAAVVSVRIGPIGARFNSTVRIEDPVPPQSYLLVGQGQGGMAGSAKGSARVELTEDGGATLLTYTVDAEVGGRLAQLGGPLIEATAKQLAARFFADFEREVTGEGAAAAAPGAGVEAAPAAAPSPIWPWLAAVAIAVIAGYLLGLSGASYGWVVGVIALALASAAAGHAAGRGRR